MLPVPPRKSASTVNSGRLSIGVNKVGADQLRVRLMKRLNRLYSVRCEVIAAGDVRFVLRTLSLLAARGAC